jgi:DNA gyrase/topoisomerase IV subunit A
MELQKDDYILLSFLNTKLRDEYSSLDELCQDLQCSLKDITERMAKIGYEYSKEKNKFI